MRFRFVMAVVLGLAVALPGIGVASAPIVNDHSTFTDTFPDNLCGVSGTSTITLVDNFKLYADGTFRDTAVFRLVFTASNGKQVQIFSAGQETGLDEPIHNLDGTITFVSTFKGLPEKLSIANGPTLLRDAGTVTVTTTVRPNPGPQGGFLFVSRTVSGEHGPHPDLDSGFAAFCDVIAPALTGP